MRSTTLTLIMTIQLHSAAIKDFDPDVAIAHWNQHGHRRPSFMEKKTKQVRLPDFTDDDTEASQPVILEKLQQDSDYDSDFSDFDALSGQSDIENDQELFE